MIITRGYGEGGGGEGGEIIMILPITIDINADPIEVIADIDEELSIFIIIDEEIQIEAEVI